MESEGNHKIELAQGSFERELEKIFLAFRAASRFGLGPDYFPGISLLLSTLCFNACGDDNDTWLSLTLSTLRMLPHSNINFAIELTQSPTKTLGRDYTTTPILFVSYVGSQDLYETETPLYAHLRAKVRRIFEEEQQQGSYRDVSTLTFLGEEWTWNDWSYTPLDCNPFPIRMERGRGASVLWARELFDSGIVAYKGWEVPTPVGLEIDPNFVQLWTELLERHNLQPRILTQ